MYCIFGVAVATQLLVTTLDDFSTDTDQGVVEFVYDVWSEYAILLGPFIAYCIVFWLLRRRCFFIIEQY